MSYFTVRAIGLGSSRRMPMCRSQASAGGHDEVPQHPDLVRRVLAGLEQALAGRSDAEPFPGQDGVWKHRFGGFNILLRKLEA